MAKLDFNCKRVGDKVVFDFTDHINETARDINSQVEQLCKKDFDELARKLGYVKLTDEVAEINDNIKITITGNYMWARQTGPDSVEVGDVPGRGSYDKATHVAISKDAANLIRNTITEAMERHTYGCTCGELASFQFLNEILEIDP